MMIDHPYRTGVRTDPSDIDAVCKSIEVVKEELAKLREYEHTLRYSLARISLDETKTRRVKGNKYVAVLTSPDDYWSQAGIKQIEKVSEFHDWFNDFFRIATYAPNLREIKKMESTTGHPIFESFKAHVLACRTPSIGPPSVKIERMEDK